MRRENLIVFPYAVAGSHNTTLSVPQIITKANPDEMDLRFKEKSILSAFKDAGFKTVWLSNQSDKEIFYSGITLLHAKTADVSIFSPAYSPMFDKFGYDGRLLPLLDSILNCSKENLFIVVHTIGSHWNYAHRYPKAFDYFQPSGDTHPGLYSREDKEVMTNTYNNSIRYADFIIDSIISIVKKQNAVSSVFYVSDHGEDVYDTDPSKLKQHTHSSWATLHVPLFIWTSGQYQQVYPQKRAVLLNNHTKRVGSENPFYTLLDMSNFSFPGFDSTKSIASAAFIESKQKYYDNLKRKAFYFKDLK
jgi:glucan phosphoethanolaminetransferase (alkaline phosphatase superfamily)